MMTSTQGVSAQGLGRVAGLGSYQTAWTMLFRTVSLALLTGFTPARHPNVRTHAPRVSTSKAAPPRVNLS